MIIEEPQAGEPINKLWEIVAQLVRVVNGLQNITVSPEGAGTFIFADANVKLSLNTEPCPTT